MRGAMAPASPLLAPSLSLTMNKSTTPRPRSSGLLLGIVRKPVEVGVLTVINLALVFFSLFWILRDWHRRHFPAKIGDFPQHVWILLSCPDNFDSDTELWRRQHWCVTGTCAWKTIFYFTLMPRFFSCNVGVWLI
jgi:hypothetical protein